MPASGAWLDTTGFQTGASSTYVRTDVAATNGGRYTNPLYSQNCDNWTATTDGSYPTSGTAILAQGRDTIPPAPSRTRSRAARR